MLFRHRDVYYAEDKTTGNPESLRTKNKSEAMSLLNAKNESFRQPSLNLHIARNYLAAVDPEIAKRPWRVAMEEISKLKSGATCERYLQAMRDPAFDLIRDLPILETPGDSLAVGFGEGDRLDQRFSAAFTISL